MMLEFIAWATITPTWAIGGALTARQAIAKAERHYLNLSEENHRRDATIPIQDTMDGDDWLGAGLFAAGAFAAFPVIAAIKITKKLTKPLHKPAKAFFEPPIQRGFNEHVRQLDEQKALVVSTAKLYNDVLNWEPKDHPDRVNMLETLEQQVKDQLSTLMRLSDPTRGFDGNYLEAAKREVKQLTAGGR